MRVSHSTIEYAIHESRGVGAGVEYCRFVLQLSPYCTVGILISGLLQSCVKRRPLSLSRCTGVELQFVGEIANPPA